MDSQICIEAIAEYHRRLKSRSVFEVLIYGLSGAFVGFVVIALAMILLGAWTETRTTLTAGLIGAVNVSMVTFVVKRRNVAAKEVATAQRELAKACPHDAPKVIESVNLASLARLATMNVNSGPGNPDFS